MIATLFALPLLAQDYVILAFCLAMGGIFGSFFNVLIYRWPRGKSLVYPGSSCPACGRPIRARHNIPVLGWFLLQGRCFDCSAPISFRYPLIEALTALTFGMLALLEPLLMGINLPSPPQSQFVTLMPTLNDLWLMAICHAVLLSGLLIAGEIDYDRQRIPVGLAVLVLIVAWGASLARPAVLPVPAFMQVLERLQNQQWAIGLVSSLYGTIAGAVFGCLMAPATGTGRNGLRGRTTGVIITAWVGAFLGWQGVGSIAAFSALVYMLAVMYRQGFTRFQHITYPLIVWVVTLTWIPLWKVVVTRLPLGNGLALGATANYWVLAWQASTVLICAIVTYWFRGPGLTAEASSPSA